MMIREAASVILLRRAEPGFEVFLLRRRKGASFMASAFVFPGGGAEAHEGPKETAARELFEEAGVLIARDIAQADTLEAPRQAVLRKRILDGMDARVVLETAGLEWSTDLLTPWAHWITPSIEPAQRSALLRAPAEPGLAIESKRFSAQFFVAELPQGQEPSFDAIETVDQVWVRPADALTRIAELALPPPQIRTLWELAELASIEHVFATARTRTREPHAILPRLGPMGLLLPWDPEYTTLGTGEAMPMPVLPSWARGPSRFVMEDRAWRHVAAPGSTTAG
jgi:8-oxo-dGTP pyrophosphatase MutT (NUDIX family)